MPGNDIVWPLIADATQFVNGMTAARKEAQKTRDVVASDMQAMRSSFNDAFAQANAVVGQRMAAERAEAARHAAAIGHGSNVFFSGTNSISSTYQRDQAEAEQRLAMMRKVNADAAAYHQSQLAGVQERAAVRTEAQIEAEQRLAMAQKVRFEAEQHQEQQRKAMRARMDAAYDQQVANEQRLAQQKAAQAASDARMDRVVRLGLENTHRQKAIALVLAEAAAEKKLADTRSMSSAASGGVGTANRWGRAFQQFSYGIEDAASQFGTMGIAGAVRGASNNLSAGLMAFGTKAGIYGSVASTALLLVTSMTSLAEAEEKERQAAERNAESQRKVLEAIRNRAEFEAKLRDERKVSTVESESKSARQSIEGIRAAEAEAKRQFDNQKALVDQKQKHLQDAYDKLNYVGAWGAGPTAHDVKTLAELGKNLETLASERRRLEKENEERQKQMPEVKKRQEADEAEKKRQEEAKKAQDDAKRDAERYYDDSLNAVEKYEREYNKIWKLRNEHPELISQRTAIKAAEKARLEMQQELNKGLHATVTIRSGTFVDARSKEALENYYKHLMTARRDIPTPTSPAAPVVPQKSDWERSQQEAQRHQEEMQAAAEEAKRLRREADLIDEQRGISAGKAGWGHHSATSDRPTYEDDVLGDQWAQGPARSRWMASQEDAAKGYGQHSWMYQDPNRATIDNRDPGKDHNAEYSKQAQLQQKLVDLTERLVKLQEQTGTKPAQQPEESVASF